MKKFALVLLVFCAAFAFGGTPNPADYPLTVHLVESHIAPYHETDLQRIVVMVDGKRYELLGCAVEKTNPGGPRSDRRL